MGADATDRRTAPAELALMPRRGRRGEPRSLYLGDDLLHAIEQVALQEDRSVSGMVRHLLIEALRARGVEVAGLSETDDRADRSRRDQQARVEEQQ